MGLKATKKKMKENGFGSDWVNVRVVSNRV
jgi:hypothetical protein